MIKKSTIETEEYFEIERAFETYFREQHAQQELIATELAKVVRQQGALLAIFAHSVELLRGKK